MAQALKDLAGTWRLQEGAPGLRATAPWRHAAVAGGLGLNLAGGAMGYLGLLPRGLGTLIGLSCALPAHLLLHAVAHSYLLNTEDAGPVRQTLKLTAWAAAQLSAGLTCVLLFPAFAVGSLPVLVAASLVGSAVAPLSYLVGAMTLSRGNDGQREALGRRLSGFVAFDRYVHRLRPGVALGVGLSCVPAFAALGSACIVLLAIDSALHAAYVGCSMGLRTPGSDRFSHIRLDKNAIAFDIVPWSPTRCSSKLSHLACLTGGFGAQLGTMDWRSLASCLAGGFG